MTTAAGTVVGIWHAGLTVTSLEDSLRFYRDGLGLHVQLIREVDVAAGEALWGTARPRARVAFLDVPGSDTQLELFEFDPVVTGDEPLEPWQVRHSHVCFYVTDLESLCKRLSSLGYRFRSARPVALAKGSLEGALAIYAIDPDGVSVELYERPS